MKFRNKTMIPWRGVVVTSGILYLFILSPVFAFRAEREGSTSKNENVSKRADLDEGTERISPTEKQTQIADDLKKSGFSIQWDSQLNSPVSIRGKGLGVASVGGQRSVASVVSGTYGQRAVSVLKNLAPLYGIQDASQELLPSGAEQKDELGFRHQRLRQVYLGLPVVGADLKVHFDKTGNPYEVSGRLVPGINLDPNPSITGDQAVASANADFIERGLAQPEMTEQPQLVIYALRGTPKLAYQLVISDGGAHTYRYYVDAKTGSVINAISQVFSIVAPSNKGRATTLQGTIIAREGGKTLQFAGWSENQIFYMYDPANFNYVYNNDGGRSDPRILGVNPANAVYLDSGTYAYRNSSDWGTSDRAEVSVAANIAYTMNYFKTVHNRMSFDGKGTIVAAVVHFGNPDTGSKKWDNAQWTGSYMRFGDGDVLFNELVVLDVCAHEVTHGVTQETAGLVYQYESGALNESFSDIFGATVEFNYQTDNRGDYPKGKPGTADWLLGEDCWLSSTAMRDMRNPANVGTVGAGRQQPSKYKGAYWYTGTGDNGGVHQNSGVQNFFYYLLCEGGSSTNDGIAYQVNGITIANARQIAYRALSVYCNQNTGYKAARNAWVSAAQDINSAWVASVEAAWDAVGVVVGRITSVLTVSGVVNHPISPYTITVKATDAPSSYSAAGLPPGLSIKGPTISGIPTEKGIFAATISAQTSSEVISDTMNFTLSDPLPNDDFFQAKTFGPSIPASATGTTVGYSREVGELAHGSGGPYSSVWLKLNANQTGIVILSTVGSDFDTTLALYKGSELSKLAKVAANNDAGVGIKTSLLQFSMEAGTTYYIAIDGNAGATGTYVLTATGPSLSQALANDMADFPMTLGNGVSFTQSGSILAATAQSGEPALAGLPATRSVWFTYTAPANGRLVVDTVGSDFNSVIGVYSGTVGVFSSLKLLAANDDIATGNLQSSVSLPVTSGTTYIIKVDGRKSSFGAYTLRGTFSVPLPSCPAPATASFTMTKVAGTTTYTPSVSWSAVIGPAGYPVTAYEVQLIYSGQSVVNSGSLSAATRSWNGTALAKLGYTARVRAIAGAVTGTWREVSAKVIQ